MVKMFTLQLDEIAFDEEQLWASRVRPISLLLNYVFVEELRFVDHQGRVCRHNYSTLG